jgi:hypothetical protein
MLLWLHPLSNAAITGTIGILVYINPVTQSSGLDRSKLVFQRVATSILLAVHHINTRNDTVVGDSVKLLPEGFKLKYKIADTHAAQSEAVKALLSWQSDEGHPALSCPAAAANSSPASPVNASRYAASPFDRIDAIVGPFRSEESAAICNLADALGLTRLPVTSYASSSSDLSDKLRFPRFSRTAPEFSLAARGLVRLITDLGWRRCALLYVDDPWGTSFATNFLSRAAAAGLLVLASPKIRDRDAAAARAAVRTAAQSGARVFVLLDDTGSNVEAVLLAAAAEGAAGRDGYAWIAYEQVYYIYIYIHSDLYI